MTPSPIDAPSDWPSVVPSSVTSASPSSEILSLAPTTLSAPTFTLGLESVQDVTQTSAEVASIYNTIANITGVFVTFNDDDNSCPGETTCTTQSASCTINSGRTSDANAFPVNSDFRGKVDRADSGCCTANSCIYSLVESQTYAMTAGQEIIIEYSAFGGGDWYECALVLFQGSNPAMTSTTVADVKIVRGNFIRNTKTDTFTIPSDGNYFVGFFAGSYGQTGGSVLGASLTIEAFRLR